MGFFVSLYRICRFALQNFWRNIWLSIITITILVLTLFIVNILLTLNVLGQTAVRAVESKIDVAVSFKPETSATLMADVRGYLQSLPQVKVVTEESPDQVLADFKEKNANKPDVLASLNEVGGNPFGPQLTITANNPSDFPFILQALDNPQYSPWITQKDYSDHEAIIKNIESTVNEVQTGGIILGIIFVFITILIIVNTIRVAIYTHREEIGIERLVGASSFFIRAPFLVESVLYTLIATIITIAVVYPLVGLIAPTLDSFFAPTTTGLVLYFQSNFLLIFGAQFIGLAVLNIISTSLAMRRYLNV